MSLRGQRNISLLSLIKAFLYSLWSCLKLKSLFDADISFAAMHVYFTNYSIVHKFTHVDEVQSTHAPMDLEPDNILAEATPVQDSSSSGVFTHAHQRSLTFAYNDTREYVMKSDINGNVLKSIDGDVLSIVKVVLFVTSPPEDFTAPLSSSPGAPVEVVSGDTAGRGAPARARGPDETSIPSALAVARRPRTSAVVAPAAGTPMTWSLTDASVSCRRVAAMRASAADASGGAPSGPAWRST